MGKPSSSQALTRLKTLSPSFTCYSPIEGPGIPVAGIRVTKACTPWPGLALHAIKGLTAAPNEPLLCHGDLTPFGSEVARNRAIALTKNGHLG